MLQKKITVRTMTYCALLAALSVVLARLIGLMPDAASRFSIEAVPIFLSGMFFGPLAGGMVGFVADFVGCMFSPYGYNPVFCIPPILYGLVPPVFGKGDQSAAADSGVFAAGGAGLLALSKRNAVLVLFQGLQRQLPAGLRLLFKHPGDPICCCTGFRCHYHSAAI